MKNTRTNNTSANIIIMKDRIDDSAISILGEIAAPPVLEVKLQLLISNCPDWVANTVPWLEEEKVPLLPKKEE